MKTIPLPPLRALALLLPLLAAACGGKGAVDAVTYPGVADHVGLPLAGTAHLPLPPDPVTGLRVPGSVTCADCHDTKSFREPPNCVGCHLPAADRYATHTQGLDGAGNPIPTAAYAAAKGPTTSADWPVRDFCLQCHPAGSAQPDFATHSTWFPIGPGTKHNRACAACHGDPAQRADPTTLNCVKCHTNQLPGYAFPAPSLDARHANVQDYLDIANRRALTPLDCLRCHDGAQVDRLAAHGVKAGPGPMGQAGPWAAPHGTSGQPAHCFTCHDATPQWFQVPRPTLTAPRPWAQDWKIRNPACSFGAGANPNQAACCTACHGTTPGGP